MNLIVTTDSRAIVQESYEVEVPDGTDFTTDDGYVDVSDRFFAALAGDESSLTIISSRTVGEPDVSETQIVAIEDSNR